MTKNSPEPDSGRLRENVDEEYNRDDDFNGEVTERYVQICSSQSLTLAF